MGAVGRTTPWIAGATCLCLLLGLLGCAGPQNLPYDVKLLATSEEGLNPSAAALLQEAKRHARTRMSGALLGATVNSVASLLPNREGAGGGARAALTGGLGGAGAVLGYAFGAYIDARNTRANMDQQKLSALIAAAEVDARNYEQDRRNAERAIQESRQAVLQLNQQATTLAEKQAAYQAQARSLAATATVLQVGALELRANTDVMGADILEAEDSKEIGDSDLHPEALAAHRDRLRADHAMLVKQYGELLRVVDVMPAPVQPAIPPMITALQPQ